MWGQVCCRYDRMASALIRLFTRAGSEPIDIRVRFCERCMTFKIMCLFIQIYSVLIYVTVTVSSIMAISPVKKNHTQLNRKMTLEILLILLFTL